MAKRFAITFFIVVGVCLFLLAIFVLVLFLAPGFSVFGIRYIASGTRGNLLERQSVSEIIGDNFTGSFIINSHEIPVNVIFTERWIYEVEYYEDFNGLTRSNIEYPNVSVSLNENGTVVIDVNEFEKFVYESSSSTRYLNLYIPLATVQGETSSYRTNLTINGGASNITFSKVEDYDLREPEFNVVEISTTGNVTYNTHVLATSFRFTTDNSIVVGENTSSIVDATNYYLTSTNGRITIERAVTGDVEAETNNFNISLVSCRNLTAKSNYGSVFGSDDDGKIDVSGLVNIQTKSGNVHLGNILGEYGASTISTGAGNVEIDRIFDAEITTTRGHIQVVSSRNLTISTNMGKVEVQEALESVDVETKRSTISLGGQGMRINNPTVFSRLGRVNIASASGTVNIHTISSDIEFANYDSEDITIVSGGALTASNLTGRVNISANDDSVISFEDISDESTLEFSDTVHSVTINALGDTINNIRYIITGVTIETYEDNGTGTFSKIIETNDTLSSMTGTGPLLHVTAESATVRIYFQAS